ncbi:ATP-binding protein [uncultured Cellulomonas sp.]|uniref:ATP-binding protein n=1 Tax=uncultured Cellulomonas sp. TaxID=189682 RepID=UPI00261FF5B7|nr:ATP-binding protein [uncultured Cellulomonas sp.]
MHGPGQVDDRGADDGSPNDPDSPADTDEGLASSRPPANFAAVRTWALNTVQELAALRSALRRELAAGADPEPELGTVADQMVLVASELATNALRHGIPPTIVQLSRNQETFLLDVADHDLRTAPRIAGTRAPGLGGFGLQIARRIALDVGWYTSRTTKHVWALFPAPDVQGRLA